MLRSVNDQYCYNNLTLNKGKGKVYPRKDHEGPKEE
jgi:hypothetical protein